MNEGDEILTVFPCDTLKFVIAAASDGHAIAVKVTDLPVLSGPGKGVMLIKLASDAQLIGAIGVAFKRDERLVAVTDKGKKYDLKVDDVLGARGGRGKQVVKRATFATVEMRLPIVPELLGGN